MARERPPIRDFTWARLGRSVALAFRAARRHKAVFGLVVAATLGLAAAGLAVMPRTYEARCRLVIRPSRSLASRFDDLSDAPARTAARLLRSDARLRDLVRETELTREWRERRAPILRLKDRLLRGGRAPLGDDEMAEVLTEMLGDRLSVSFSRDGSLEIVVRWADPVMAFRLVTTAEEEFLETWHALEVASISELVSLLEAHAATAKTKVDRHLDELHRRGGRLGSAGLAPPAPDAGDRDGARQFGDDAEAVRDPVLEARRRALADLAQLQERLSSASRRRFPDRAPSRAPASPLDVDTQLHFQMLRFGPPLQSGPGEGEARADRSHATGPRQDDVLGSTILLTEEIVLGEIADRLSPLADSARNELVEAAQWYAALLDRIEAARLELETSGASFAERYVVVLPPEVPRYPIRPTAALVILAALLDGLLLGLVAAFLVERRRIAAAPIAIDPRDGEARASPSAHDHVSARGLPRDVLLVATLGGASLVAVWAGDGNPGIAVVPLVLALVILATFRLSLRDTLPALAFLCLTLENPTEIWASGQWRSPLFTVGALFLAHMNLTLPVKALFFSGLDIALVVLVVALVVRRAAGVGEGGPVPMPAAPPMRNAALLCLATILIVWAYGMARGGHFGNSLWQVFRLVYLPTVLLLFITGTRGPSDGGRFGKVLLLAALLRAVVAIYVRRLFPDTEAVPFTTIHADSMLFADAFLLVLVMFFERPSGKALLLALATLPILAWGMIANNRRLVWFELGLAAIAILLLTRWTPLKRNFVRAVALSTPLLLGYVAAGWGHPAGVFAPVRILRSVVDSSSDASTAWRDLENYNIIQTARRNPVLGTGLGHGYDEVVRLPDISSGYALYRYAPHNSVLGLVAYTGAIGFAGLWMIIPLGVFFAVRSYRCATDPRDRIAALTSVGVLVTYMVHCYGDMGLGTWASVFTVAPALALVAKIAVATGAWPTRPRAAGP